MDKIIMTIITAVPYTALAVVMINILIDTLSDLNYAIKSKDSIKEAIGDVIVQGSILAVVVVMLIYSQNYIWGK